MGEVCKACSTRGRIKKIPQGRSLFGSGKNKLEDRIKIARKLTGCGVIIE